MIAKIKCFLFGHVWHLDMCENGKYWYRCWRCGKVKQRAYRSRINYIVRRLEK